MQKSRREKPESNGKQSKISPEKFSCKQIYENPRNIEQNEIDNFCGKKIICNKDIPQRYRERIDKSKPSISESFLREFSEKIFPGFLDRNSENSMNEKKNLRTSLFTDFVSYRFVAFLCLF
jgi:hypothetical protein